MIRFLVILLCHIFLTAAFAQDAIVCGAESMSLRPEMPYIVVKVTFEGNKPKEMTFNDKMSNPVLKTVTADLENFSEFMKCDIQKNNCIQNFYPKADLYKKSMVMAPMLISFYKKEGLITQDLELPIDQVRSAKIYAVDEGSPYFGVQGLIEYMSGGGKVVGRIMYAIEAMECK